MWGTNYIPKVHFGPAPATVTLHKNETVEHVTLRDFVKQRCPSLYAEFRPVWWLPDGHFQTLYSVIGDFSKRDKVVYKRTYLRLLDGGTLGLDFTPVEDGHLKADTPVIVVMHGLTGGSYESYVRSILAPACSLVEQGGLGYRAVVVNFRGCAGVPVTSPQLYSAGHTDDIRQALFYIAHRYPKAPLIGLGFSLGANVMTRYIAEEGDACRLTSGCVLGCPWNLLANSDRLRSTYIGRYLYSQGMARNLVNLLGRHMDALTKNPEHQVAKAAFLTSALKKPDLQTFDDHFTRIAGGSSPPFPFQSAHDYYVYSSSDKMLGGVRIPFLAINAADDPVVQDVPMDAKGNEWIVMALSSKGGHLGWFEQDGAWNEVSRWIRKPVLEWLRATAENLVSKNERGRPLQEVDGFLTEVGRNELGCKEIEGGGLVVGTDREAGLLAGL